MTIGCIISIIIGVILFVGGLVLGCVAIHDEETGFGIGIIITSVILAAILIVCPFIYMNTETGARALKDQQSNFGDGIERVVRVYDIEGELIEQYEGKFDVETNKPEYVLFDDESGKRHIIYRGTSTILIDEK